MLQSIWIWSVIFIVIIVICLGIDTVEDCILIVLRNYCFQHVWAILLKVSHFLHILRAWRAVCVCVCVCVCIYINSDYIYIRII